MGRPPKYKTAKELQNEIDAYFVLVEDIKTETPTITGLAYYLGFDSRQSMYDYEEKKAFSYIIKRAKLRIEAYYEGLLMKQYSSGAIFALKNLGWSDRQEIDHTSKGEKITGFSYIKPSETNSNTDG